MKNYDVVIIGGGVIGCCVAYNLSKMGLKNVLVIEKDYLSSGSTGRCGGGIRQQWGTEANCRLAMESVKIFEQLEEELGEDIEWHQGGYLLLAFTEEEEEQFKKNVALQQRVGVPVRLVTSQEAKEIVPALNVEGVRVASYCPTDGHANPSKVTIAYAKNAKKNGVDFLIGREVVDGIVDDEGGNKVVRGVVLDNGEKIYADKVLNAAGAFSREVGMMFGVEIPTTSYRHQILVTEPLERFFDPLIISFYHHVYFRQEKAGGVVMGYGDPKELPSTKVNSTFDFAKTMAHQILDLMPVLRDVRVVRQWAGSYNMSPDAQPILGTVDGVEGYYQAVGFSGHGFMLAPAVGRAMAEMMLGKDTFVDVSYLSVNRFKGGVDTSEVAVV